MDISVIVALYQPDLKKTLMTLTSIIRQSHIDFEVILSDDGSSIDILNEVKNYFETCNFSNYKFLKHKKNVGTVRNYFNAVLAAQGEYVYLISPGDCLFDESTLSNMFVFVQENNCEFCFGLAQYYSNKDEKFELYGNPYLVRPIAYQPDRYDCEYAKINFFNENMPVGASYLRKRSVFIQYLKEIIDRVRYIEDKPTSYMYLLEHKKLLFYPNYVVWYEVGEGISTSSSGSDRLKADSESINKLIASMYSEDSIVRYKVLNDHSIAVKERVEIEVNNLHIRTLRKIKRLCSKIQISKDLKARFDFMTKS